MAAVWEIHGSDAPASEAVGLRATPDGVTLAPGTRRGRLRLTAPDVGPFDRLLASLNPEPWPAGSRARVTARARVAAGWTRWLDLGVYGGGPGLPRSVEGAPSRGVDVATDVLRIGSGTARAAEVTVELSAGADGAAPVLRRLALVRWREGELREPPGAPHRPSPAWGRVLAVPTRSQAVEDPAIAHRICSPTSLAMVLAYHGRDLPTPEVAAAVYDRGADIYGNWCFNVARAGELGLSATATRLEGFLDLEAEVAAGRPVVISHRYARGALSDTPVPSTEGHLIVVRGFTEAGDAVVNDPAADPRAGEAIRRVYRRAELAHTWLENADGIAYVIG